MSVNNVNNPQDGSTNVNTPVDDAKKEIVPDINSDIENIVCRNCSLCHKLIPIKDFSLHQAELCDERKINCPDCKQLCVSKELSIHLSTVCAERDMKCQIEYCSFVGSPSKLIQHKQDKDWHIEYFKRLWLKKCEEHSTIWKEFIRIKQQNVKTGVRQRSSSSECSMSSSDNECSYRIRHRLRKSRRYRCLWK